MRIVNAILVLLALIVVVVVDLFVHLFHFACCQFTPPPPLHLKQQVHTTTHDMAHPCPTVVVPVPCHTSCTLVHNTPLDLIQHSKSANSACPITLTWLTPMYHTLYPHIKPSPVETSSSDMCHKWHIIQSTPPSISCLPFPDIRVSFRPSPNRQHNTTINHSIPNSTIYLIEYHVPLVLQKYFFPHSKPEPDQVKSLTYSLTYLLTHIQLLIYFFKKSILISLPPSLT